MDENSPEPAKFDIRVNVDNSMAHVETLGIAETGLTYAR